MKNRFFCVLLALCLGNVWAPVGAFAFQTENWVRAKPQSVQADVPYLISLIQSRAKVCGIQFDDGNVTHYTRATPILLQYGLIGSFGIVTGNTNVNPYAMTDTQVAEMYYTYGYDFQDHTWNHDAAFWGNPSNVATWLQHIAWSQEVFERIGFPGPMRAWNQPGGPGEGWSALLRATLVSQGYEYAAGRVGISNYDFRNMHFGSIADPFSWGRWCYSWTYNAPAMALEAQGVDLFTSEGRNLLEATAAIINGDVVKSDQLLLQESPTEMLMVQEIAAAYTWQAEVEVLKQRYADAWAVGGEPIVVFHTVDEAHGDAPAGLDALCAWLVQVGAVVLGMDDLNALAQLDRVYQSGINIAPPLDKDDNGDGFVDGSDTYGRINVIDGTAGNGAGTYFMGTPPGQLVVSVTMRTPVQTAATDDFIAVYERYSIDPDTWQYTVAPQELRSHTINQGETLTFTDTLTIDERVDRVKFWLAGIGSVNLPVVIDDWSAIPQANPTGVAGRTPRANLVVKVAPNPTGGLATISFRLDHQVATSVAIYDAQGRLVDRLMEGQPLNGNVSLSWQNDRVASGIYFAKITAGTVVTNAKITLIR